MERFYALAKNNRKLIEKAHSAICIDCGEEVYFTDVKSWIDDGQTSVCPYCGKANLIPRTTREILRDLYNHFCK